MLRLLFSKAAAMLSVLLMAGEKFDRFLQKWPEIERVSRQRYVLVSRGSDVLKLLPARLDNRCTAKTAAYITVGHTI
jgi:hypothetical protein